MKLHALCICLAALLLAPLARADAASDAPAAALVSAVEAATGWTADELVAGLDRLDRVYQNDMKTASGRLRWHGAVVENTVDTNRLVKIQRHEDGYLHETPFTPREPASVASRLSAAERAAAREAAAAKRRQERLAELDARFDELAAELAARRAWPLDLAKMVLESERNALATNVVNAVVVPQR